MVNPRRAQPTEALCCRERVGPFAKQVKLGVRAEARIKYAVMGEVAACNNVHKGNTVALMGRVLPSFYDTFEGTAGAVSTLLKARSFLTERVRSCDRRVSC